ncbi:hypothetical protein EYZ11_008198 [Aspergillus tanneri]|uniref:Uncharacterized protein n=1 Tax=Aspergillus tanneri TaxID=1220188 RepID=A0A4S3JB19_9EURO|nr:hypothetical protein EYZ11_008198 [Aspergillus tanneri]
MSSDAAALPSPPDFAPWEKANRPQSLGSMYSGEAGQIGPPGLYQNNHSTPPLGARSPRFPSIKDLQEHAAALDVDESSSPDIAYVEYLRASEITVNIIPHHADYRIAATQRPGWYKQFADLMMAVRTKQGTMDDIKRQILEDNFNNNVQPTGALGRGSLMPMSEFIPVAFCQTESLAPKYEWTGAGYKL